MSLSTNAKIAGVGIIGSLMLGVLDGSGALPTWVFWTIWLPGCGVVLGWSVVRSIRREMERSSDEQ